MAELTPMMKQYLEIKKDNPDSILFFRLGDFYEMFADDAKLASKELDLTLTSRDHGKNAKPEEERVPMCGIPYHASESYIARLIAKGYKVAICEQMEDRHRQGPGGPGHRAHCHPRHRYRRRDAGREPQQLHLRHLPGGGELRPGPV